MQAEHIVTFLAEVLHTLYVLLNIHLVVVWSLLLFSLFRLMKTLHCLVLDDSRRPWVRQEKERFKALLESNGLAVQEHKYFDGVEPTLLMHFEVIQAMRRGQWTVT